MARKLASIQRIWKIEPIEGADRIELVRVCGWQCIAKKEEFKKYDLCVYIEIDSVCPKEDERFAMLASTNWKVKTRKMKNTLSQGIALPLSLFGWTELDVTLEDDVTEQLGIKLFENYESFNAQEARGGFPGFVRKTDQERCVSGDMLIETEDGLNTIRCVCEEGYYGKVKCFSHLTNEIEYKPILARNISRNKNNWIKIKTKSGKELIVTEDHKIWNETLGHYTNAIDNKVGDFVIIS